LTNPIPLEQRRDKNLAHAHLEKATADFMRSFADLAKAQQRVDQINRKSPMPAERKGQK